MYYPGRRRFAPDLLLVRDVEVRDRTKWVVSAEGKGLDWVMEVHYGGAREGAAVSNIEFYASLGIPECFVYDRRAQRLFGHRLDSGPRGSYRPLTAERGRMRSAVLGLDLTVEHGKLCLYRGATRIRGTAEQLELMTRLHARLAHDAPVANGSP